MGIFTGNGPSAIVLSYLLSGHIPYWNGCPVSNDYLNVKLEQYVKDNSLLEQVRCAWIYFLYDEIFDSIFFICISMDR